MQKCHASYGPIICIGRKWQYDKTIVTLNVFVSDTSLLKADTDVFVFFRPHVDRSTMFFDKK